MEKFVIFFLFFTVVVLAFNIIEDSSSDKKQIVSDYEIPRTLRKIAGVKLNHDGKYLEDIVKVVKVLRSAEDWFISEIHPNIKILCVPPVKKCRHKRIRNFRGKCVKRELLTKTTPPSTEITDSQTYFYMEFEGA